jgi:hypothetical protein
MLKGKQSLTLCCGFTRKTQKGGSTTVLLESKKNIALSTIVLPGGMKDIG